MSYITNFIQLYEMGRCLRGVIKMHLGKFFIILLFHDMYGCYAVTENVHKVLKHICDILPPFKESQLKKDTTTSIGKCYRKMCFQTCILVVSEL